MSWFHYYYYYFFFNVYKSFNILFPTIHSLFYLSYRCWPSAAILRCVCIIVLLIKVWKVCIIGFDYQGANSFRKVCVIVRNLRLLLINFLVVESEWVDTVIVQPSPFSGWSFCHFGLIFELWMTCFCISRWCLFCCFMWTMFDYLSWSVYRSGNWFGLSCTWAVEVV